MKLNISLKYCLAFLSLVFVMHEAHELAHTIVGRLICGCWGQRDFNSWGVCEGCADQKPIAILSTFAGPVFTFVMIWAGVYLIGRDKTDRQKSAGFSLIFACLPFARILTASMGSGDEVWGLHHLTKNQSAAWSLGLLLVLTMTLFPLWKAFKLIGNKRRIGWFLIFLILPGILDVLIVLGVMNTLLQKGILSDYWILGSPMIVTVWTGIAAAMLLLTGRNIYNLFSMRTT